MPIEINFDAVESRCKYYEYHTNEGAKCNWTGCYFFVSPSKKVLPDCSSCSHNSVKNKEA